MYPDLRVNLVSIRTSEALCQAMKYPHLPDLQMRIVAARSPIIAKRIQKPFKGQMRSDWDDIRIDVMRWALRVKLAQNYEKFSKALLAAEDKEIVELSDRDDFWGVVKREDGVLVGRNWLGRLLVELRDNVVPEWEYPPRIIPAPAIKDFKLNTEPVGVVRG